MNRMARGLNAIMRNVKVRTISIASIAFTMLLGALCVGTFIYGRTQFTVLENANETYELCQECTNDLRDASTYLTEQARLAAVTGDTEYIDNYFAEINDTQRRQNAVRHLKSKYDGTDAMNQLQAALDASDKLVDTELYSMRLVCDAQGVPESMMHSELRDVLLGLDDRNLTSDQKMARAQQLVFDDHYQDARSKIMGDVDNCIDSLLAQTAAEQASAASSFEMVYRWIEVSVALFVAVTLLMCLFMRTSIIDPLIRFGERVRENRTFPVVGAAELQTLAETYNEVYLQNEETQRLIKHQADHDALTDLLNRGSYDRILDVYEAGDEPFALILIDVDTFKGVNDGYGHASGDKILKRVARLLKTTFRDIDHICRIGGDEFAIIMVKMTSDLRYTIEEKIDFINEQLAVPEGEGLPAVSLSVGVAFTDRENPGPSLFRDADKALYYVKEHGRGGYCFYGDPELREQA